MKKIFKSLCLLLMAGLMVFALVGCKKSCEKDPTQEKCQPTEKTCEEDPTQEKCKTEKTCEEDPTQEKCKAAEPTGTLQVGSSTELSRNFWTTIWGNNGANAKIRDLIYGYGTVVFTKEEKFEIDHTVVKDFKEEVNADGSHTYTFEINEGLKWSDGAPVTAKDYVGSALLTSNSVFYEVAQKDASTSGTVLGSVEYLADKTGLGEFTGVDLLGDYKFAVTVNAENRYGEANYPYYYEYLYYSFAPDPMHILVPGVEIIQGDEGAKFSGVDYDTLKSKIDKSVEDNGNGYRYKPMVSCGPYKFHSFDTESSTCTVTYNPYFQGDYAGQKAQIATVIMKYVTTETQMDALLNGEIDLIEQISGGGEINAGLAQIVKSDGKINFTNYSRCGYGVLAFHADHSPTRFTEVRQAIAYLLNRQDFLDTYTGGYGILPHGRYGLAQWMVARATDASGNIMGIDETGKQVALNPYSYNPEKATELVEAAGYIYGDAACKKLYAEGDEVRYRKNEDGTTEPLTIEWSKTTPNPVSETLMTTLVPNAAAIGLKINGTTVDFNTLLYRDYYGANGDGYGDPSQIEDITYDKIMETYNKGAEQDVRVATMFNLGSNFSLGQFEPYPDYCLEYWGWDGGGNINYFYDEDMATVARGMTEAANDDEYFEAWQKFQYYFNKFLPELPLYSDLYHEFFSSKLKGYKNEVTANWGWSYQILYCTMEG